MTSPTAERLMQRHYGHLPHPYVLFERAAFDSLPSGGVLLDAGCGRTAPILAGFRGRAGRLIGIDLVEFANAPDGLELHHRDLGDTGLDASSVDLVIARSVVEHLERPTQVLSEFYRILKPGGRILFLTANLWDYGSLIAAAIPNRWHGRIVARVEGRDEHDVFPTAYRMNTRSAIRRHAVATGFRVASFEYLSQYPNYLMFNGAAFFVGMCYEKLISSTPMLGFLRGWILCALEKPADPVRPGAAGADDTDGARS